MIIAGLWRYGDWRHVTTGCNALVITNDNVYGAVIMERPLREFTKLQTERQMAANRQPKSTNLACESAIIHFIVYIRLALQVTSIILILSAF